MTVDSCSISHDELYSLQAGKEDKLNIGNLDFQKQFARSKGDSKGRREGIDPLVNFKIRTNTFIYIYVQQDSL